MIKSVLARGEKSLQKEHPFPNPIPIFPVCPRIRCTISFSDIRSSILAGMGPEPRIGSAPRSRLTNDVSTLAASVRGLFRDRRDSSET